MAVRIWLNSGQQVISPLSQEEILDAFQKALDKNTVLTIKQGNGHEVIVNPMQIVSWEEVDDATAEALVNGAAAREEVPA